MKRRGKIISGAVGVVGLALAGLFFSAQPASANHYSWLYNQRGSTMCLSWYPGYNGYCNATVGNNTKFVMQCWTEHQWFNGNYGSKKWFYGQSWSGYYGYMHASYVYYQKTVPRC